MPVNVIDVHEVAREGKRKVLFDTPKFSTWVHVYATPKKKMDMHCHNYDETFYLVEGECTMHFPDGGSAVMKPGMVATISGGSFYQLENSGDGPMVLMGNRAGAQGDSTYVHYETRKAYKGRQGFDAANPDAQDRRREKDLIEKQ
jgi:mannose-6-phosphate isomerase-like protein (cupin superfamily)